jgi:ABC-type transporter Mla MlaB component
MALSVLLCYDALGHRRGGVSILSRHHCHLEQRVLARQPFDAAQPPDLVAKGDMAMAYDPNQQAPQPGGYPQQPYQQQYPPTQQAYPQAQPNYAQSQPGYPQPQQGYQSQPATYAQYDSAQPQTPYGMPTPAAGAGFNFGAMWKNLMLPGQVASISGIVLFLSFFLFSWVGASFLGVTVATLTGAQSADTGGLALLLWLVPLAGIALVVLPILGALGKMVKQQVNLYVLISAGVALLCEIIFLIRVSTLLGQYSSEAAAAGVGIGPGFGFFLAVLATLAGGGVWGYFNFMKKPAMPGMMGMPMAGQQPYQQPGSQPYQQPGSQPYQQPGSQPYQQPGSQPYAQPGTQYPQQQYPQQQQYPGQYPGQQPPYQQ